MKHYIFMRSCRKDIPWLDLSLQTILRYATGFDGIMVTFPFEDMYPMTGLIQSKFGHAGIRMQPVPRMTEDYIGQQNTKLQADLWLGSDCLITYLDSDVMLTGPLHASQLGGPGASSPMKPLFLYTPYDSLAADKNVMAWKEITQFHMGEEVTNEFMRRLPITVHSNHLAGLRKWYFERTGMPLQHVLTGLSQNGRRDFSEFNLIGAYCWRHHGNDYAWVNTATEAFAPLPIKQYWSWGGLQAEHVREINAFLAVPQLPSASAPAPDEAEDKRTDPPIEEPLSTFEDAQREAREPGDGEVGL